MIIYHFIATSGTYEIKKADKAISLSAFFMFRTSMSLTFSTPLPEPKH